jgi:hypothetical protein
MKERRVFMKKYATIFLFCFSWLIVSCASYSGRFSDAEPDTAPLAVQDEKDAQVIVYRLDNDGGNIAIYIDGEYAGKLGNGQKGMYKVTTGGMHKITASYDGGYQYYEHGKYVRGHFGKLTHPIEFSIDNNVYTFYVKYLGFEQDELDYERDGVFTFFDYVELSGGNIIPFTSASVEGAVARASEQVLKNIPANSKIAVVYITAQDNSTTEYVVGELEYIWVNKGYFLTDRSQLGILRQEQNFQLSGEVDDETAVSIGKFVGANIIVTGSVDGDGGLRRLRLRALDTQTAQVVGVASERF